MNALTATLAVFWQQRLPRERRIIVAGAALLVIAIVARAALPALLAPWQSQQRVTVLQKEIAQLSAALVEREQLPGDCSALLAIGADSRDQLLAAVAADQGVQLSRIDGAQRSEWQGVAASGDTLLRFALQATSCVGVAVPAAAISINPAATVNSQYRVQLTIADRSTSEGDADGE